MEDGFLYIRNQCYIFTVVQGDIIGTVIYIGNWNVDLATGNGVGWGTNDFSGNWVSEGSLKGSIAWSGHSLLRVTDFGGQNQVVTGIFIAHGELGLEGMHIKGYFEPDPISGMLILAGTINNPHG